MAFNFGAGCLIDPTILSQFIWGVDDASDLSLPVGGGLPLKAQQVIAVNILAKGVSQQIKRYLGFSIVKGLYTEIWDGAASDELVPREFPIIDVTKFVFAANGHFEQGTDLVAQAGTEIVWTDGYTIKLRNMRTPMGRGIIQVTYNAGYENVPDDIVMAAILQFQWAVKQMGKGDPMVGLSSIGKLQENQTKDATLAKYGIRSEVAAMIATYRRFQAPLSVMFTRHS